MRLVVVPNALRDALNARLDAVLRDAPPDMIAERDQLYQQLLAYYDDHGVIPEFSVVQAHAPVTEYGGSPMDNEG